MSGLLKDVGAVAGLASFLGLALLSLLYFAQARDIRRLRENASFLVENGNTDGEGVAPAERTASAVAATTTEPEQAAATAAATAPSEAEAFRRAELARQAAERRKRFEQRRQRPNGGDGERPSWLPEPMTIAVIVVGALLVIAGIAFGVSRITAGSSDSSATQASTNGKGPCPPGQTKVAVLNGTATPGLAAQSAAQLKRGQYKVGPVGNTSTPYTNSVVMFDSSQQQGRPCASVIGQIVGISKSQGMTAEVRQAAEGNPVAVVLGDDKAGASSANGASSTGSGI